MSGEKGNSFSSEPGFSLTCSSQIGSQDLAAGGVFQPFDRFFLDLSYPFPGEVEFFPDFFQGMGMFAVQAEIQSDDIGFPVRKGGEGPFNFLSERVGKKFFFRTGESLLSIRS